MNAGEGPPSGKKRSPLIAAAVGVVLVLTLLAAWKHFGSNPQLLPPPVSGRPADLFKEAKGLVRAGKWAEAKAKLEALREEEPDYEPRQIDNYLKLSEVEIPNQRKLADAHDAISQGQLAKAGSLLAQVKTSTQQAALDAAKTALDLKVTERLAEAATLLSTPGDLAKMERLKALCEDLLVLRPGDRDAAEFKKQAETAIARLKTRTGPVVTVETPWVEAQQRFKNGDSSGALSLARACAGKYAQCRTLMANIESFEAQSQRLELLSDAELLKLFELDRTIAGGGSSELSQPLRKQLSSKFFLKASGARSTGNWAKAVEAARIVLKADPGHSGAQGLINEGRVQAQDLFLRGYQLRETNPDEAIRLYKEVLAMTPADDDLHLKVQQRLSDLQKP